MTSLYLRAEHDLNEVRTIYDQTRVGLVLEANLDGMGFGTARRIRGAASWADAAHYDLSATRNAVARRVEQLLADREEQTDLLISNDRLLASLRIATMIGRLDELAAFPNN